MLTAAAGAPDAGSTFFIIDFGLARKYVDERGAVNPQVRTRTSERASVNAGPDAMHSQRSVAQFRGSSKYASVFTHQEQDQGRRDDLWSLLYILVECVDGVLPWAQVGARRILRRERLTPVRPCAQEGTKRDERDREEILRRKKEAMELPTSLTTNVALPVQARATAPCPGNAPQHSLTRLFPRRFPSWPSTSRVRTLDMSDSSRLHMPPHPSI